MRKLFILICLIILVTGQSQAQQGGVRVQGKVLDGSTKTIESATIGLHRSTDSVLVKMAVADKSGSFVFENVAAGRYQVAVSAVGHEPLRSDVFEVKAGQGLELPALQLVPVAKAISGVTVTARKPLIEQKPDRTIVNVEASPTNVGNSALEVLEKSPGITVDKDGNISLKGKQGVQVYIDGRPSYLSGADLANLLKSMNASQLDQIEIMTNPPARYDAAGNSGVINIRTKKTKQFGYNGSITTGYTLGWYARFNESVNFNYRTGKINLFTSLNYNKNHRGENLFIKRNFREPVTKDISSMFEQESRMVNSGDFFSGKLGLDYSASKRTTLGFVLNGFYNPSEWQSRTPTWIYDPAGNLQSRTYAYTRNDEKWKNYSVNLNFRTVLDSAGQELTGDFDHIQYRSTNFQPLYSSYFDHAGNPTLSPDTLLGNLPQDIYIYSGKLDYSLPLGKGAKLEAGLKSSYVETDNNAIYENLVGGTAVLDSGRSNHFVYDENINAAYVNYSRPLGKKWNAQMGLRLENTNANGLSKGYTWDQAQNKFTYTEKEFKRRYTQLFPTVYLQYVASEKNQWVINYGRRVNRPNYQDLNPFINFLDRYTFQQGNPDLKPQFSHNIELSHTYKGFLTSTLNYTQTDDIIQQVFEQNEATNETYIKKANIASLKQVGLSVSAFKELNKWWSGSIYVNVFSNHFKGVVNNDPVSVSIAGVMVQAQQQFKLGKGWNAEVSGFYRTKGVEGVIYIRQIGQVSAGFSKQVLKNKGTVRVSVRDIFAMGVYNGYSRYGDVDVKFKNVNDSRALSLGFTWRFNKGKLNGAGQRKKGGADDEQKRVSVGGN